MPNPTLKGRIRSEVTSDKGFFMTSFPKEGGFFMDKENKIKTIKSIASFLEEKGASGIFILQGDVLKEGIIAECKPGKTFKSPKDVNLKNPTEWEY